MTRVAVLLLLLLSWSAGASSSIQEARGLYAALKFHEALEVLDKALRDPSLDVDTRVEALDLLARCLVVDAFLRFKVDPTQDPSRLVCAGPGRAPGG